MRIPFLDTIKLIRIRKKWRKLNSHNATQIAGEIPFNLIKIGVGTYGMLNIHSFTEESGERLIIGNYVSIASNVNFILGGNHQINHITTYPLKSRLFNQKFWLDCQSNGPIIIEDEVWIGTEVIILSGITVGKGAIIASGSVVTKDVPPYSVVGGNPARIIKLRLEKNIVDKLQHISLIDFDEEVIKNNIDLFYNPINEENIDEVVNKLMELKNK